KEAVTDPSARWRLSLFSLWSQSYAAGLEMRCLSGATSKLPQSGMPSGACGMVRMRSGIPLSLPWCNLTSCREVRRSITHLDYAKLNQLRQVILVDYQGALRLDVFQRPPQIDGVEPKLSKRIILLIGHPA